MSGSGDPGPGAGPARGRFITVEGVEGAGKSTQLRVIASHLAERGREVLSTREPGGTPLSEAVRGLLLDPGYAGMCPAAELLLMFAARAEHLSRVILPALERGTWVVCDRFTDATYAYQGGGRGIARERIAVLEDWVQGELRPDRVILLDTPVATGFERIRGRTHRDRFEREEQAFFERVRSTYLERARRDPGRYRVVDTRASVPEVSDGVVAALEDLQ